MEYVYVNEAYRRSFGQRDYSSETVFTALPQLEGQVFFSLLRQVYQSGEAVVAESPILLGDTDELGPIRRRLQYSYTPVRDSKGEVGEIVCEGRLLASAESPHLEAINRANKSGARSLTDQDLLAAFLGDEVDERAHILLQRFGNLREVFAASSRGAAPSEPDAVRLGWRAVVRLEVVREIHRRVLLQRLVDRPLLGSGSLLREYLRVSLADQPREQFRVLFLDTALRLINDELLSEGTATYCAVYASEVLRRALTASAHGLVLIHNHPARSKKFSAADLQVTREIVAGAAALKLQVHDHLLVAGDAVLSLRKVGPWPYG